MPIVFIPPIKWNDLYQRPQHIAMLLSRKFTILWIDDPTFFLKAFFETLLGKAKLINCVSDNLYIFQTFTFIPFSRIRIIKRINEILWYLLIKIYAVIFFRKYVDLIYYVCLPLPLLTLIFKRGLLLYDRCDRFYKFKGATEKTRLDDVKLMKKAWLVINSSEALWREARKYNDNSILVRNGADLKKLSLHTPKKNTRKKVIGYIGTISYWIDFDLLKKLAETYPEYEIHLVGPLIEKDKILKALKNIKNLKFCGKVPYDEVPKKLNEFDIGIVPFKIDELTKAVDPVKVYEYMAAGKNVVSTNLPELHRLNNYIYIAKNHEQFIKFCDEAIRRPKVSPETLIKIASENTWEKRVEQIQKEIFKRYLILKKN
ncbi:MAG: glycosyltransferase [Nitrososphaeria archaeon]